jgi:ATP-dependent Clp protease ATP-binding subunit ClpA
MFRRMRTRARDMRTITELLDTAEKIARRRGATQPAAEHLVLAALELPDGTARRAFERLGVSPDAFASGLDAQHAEALQAIGIQAHDDEIDAHVPQPVPATGIYHSEPSAQQLFQLAGKDARHEGRGFVGAHVLRAATTLEHGTTARTLDYMGVDRPALRDAVTAEVDAHHSP